MLDQLTIGERPNKKNVESLMALTWKDYLEVLLQPFITAINLF